MKLEPRKILDLLRAELHHEELALDALRPLLLTALARPGYEVAADYLAEVAAQGLAAGDPRGWALAGLAAAVLPGHPRAPDHAALLDRWEAPGPLQPAALGALAEAARGGALTPAPYVEAAIIGLRRCTQDLTSPQAEALIALSVAALARCAAEGEGATSAARRLLAALRGAARWGEADAPGLGLEAVPAEVREHLFERLHQHLHQYGHSYFMDAHTGRPLGRRWERYAPIQEAAPSYAMTAAVAELSLRRDRWAPPLVEALLRRLYDEGVAGLRARGVELRRAPPHAPAPPPRLHPGATLIGYDAQLAVAQALAAAEALLRVGERTLAQQTAISVLDALERAPGQGAYRDWAHKLAYPRALL
jgi:hypothetical protein